ncbi:MAG: TonB-dependent receptor [Stenotrophomonas sp.]
MKSLAAAIPEILTEGNLMPLKAESLAFPPTTTQLPNAFRPIILCSLLALSHGLHAAPNDEARAAGDTSSAKEDTVQLAPVVISGRKSDLDEPKTQPYGTTTVSAEDLTTQRLESVEQVLRATPGVSVNSSSGIVDNNVYIRGVGSLYQSSSDDLSFGLSIDGVQVPSRYLSLGTLDAQGISILKGPQGTRTSASGAAGLIDVRTQRPTSRLDGYVRAEIGQDGKNLEEAAISGPLTDKFSGRIAIRHAGEDLWVKNSQTGGPASKPDDLAFRASLLGEITPRTFIELNASQQRIKESPNLLVLRPYGGSPQIDLPADVYRVNDQKLGLYSLRVSHDTDASSLSATTGYTTTDFTRVLAYDQSLYQALYGVPGSYWQTYQGSEHVFSQDLRWASLQGAPVAWNLGAYFSNGKRSNNTLNQAPARGNMYARDYATRRYAVYGNVTYPLTDVLKLDTGLRHEWSRRTYDALYNGWGGPSIDQRRLDDDYTTGRIGLSYDWTQQTMVYASLSRGHNPASFQDFAGQVADSAPYKAAKVDALELGVKSATDDQRFEFNAAVFYNNVKDNQTLVYDSATYVSNVVNLDTRSKGVEVGGKWRVDSSLSLTAGLAYTDATIASALNTSVGRIDSGNRMPDVAKWSAALGAQYRKSLPGFLGLSSPVLNAQANYVYMGRRAADPQNHFDLGSYGKLDVRIGIQQGRGEFYLWADNVLDKQYDLYGYWASPTATYGAPSRGRIVGVGFRYQL